MSKDEQKVDAATQATDSKRGFAQRSSLYQEFLAERDEILRHKWLESEKKGRDIGFERALLGWVRKHREGWRRARSGKGTGD